MLACAQVVELEELRQQRKIIIWKFEESFVNSPPDGQEGGPGQAVTALWETQGGQMDKTQLLLSSLETKLLNI